MPEYYDDDDFGYDDDDWCGYCGECESCWEDMMNECGLQPDGSCLLVGTEHCDWDCRMRELDEEVI